MPRGALGSRVNGGGAAGRVLAEGQNTLVIEPDSAPDQDPLAESKVVAFEGGAESAHAVADLTAAYAKRALEVRRDRVMHKGADSTLGQPRGELVAAPGPDHVKMPDWLHPALD